MTRTHTEQHVASTHEAPTKNQGNQPAKPQLHCTLGLGLTLAGGHQLIDSVTQAFLQIPNLFCQASANKVQRQCVAYVLHNHLPTTIMHCRPKASILITVAAAYNGTRDT